MDLTGPHEIGPCTSRCSACPWGNCGGCVPIFCRLLQSISENVQGIVAMLAYYWSPGQELSRLKCFSIGRFMTSFHTSAILRLSDSNRCPVDSASGSRRRARRQRMKGRPGGRMGRVAAIQDTPGACGLRPDRTSGRAAGCTPGRRKRCEVSEGVSAIAGLACCAV